MHEVKTQWLDVDGRQAPTRSSTPSRARATTGASPSPTTSRTPTAAARRATRGRPTTTARSSAPPGHLHPGGLWTDLKVTRAGRTVRGLPLARALLRARRRGLVGRLDDRDAAQLARRGQEGRRALGLGHLRLAHDVVVRVDGDHAGGDDASRRPAASTPSRTNTAVQGVLTHGHLPENDHHGGAPGYAARRHQAPRRPARRRRSTSPASPTGRATCRSTGALGRPPVVSPGQPLTFVNDDARAERLPHHHRVPRAVHGDDRHRLPAGQRPGGLRLRRARLRARPASPPAANRKQWQTPTTLTRRDVHVLLPHPSVHARRVPREGVAAALLHRPAAARRAGRAGGGVGARRGARRSTWSTRPTRRRVARPARRSTPSSPLGSDHSVHASQRPVDRRRRSRSCARRTTRGVPVAGHLLRRPGAGGRPRRDGEPRARDRDRLGRRRRRRRLRRALVHLARGRLRPPARGRRSSRGRRRGLQAFAVGPSVGLQFHPEVTPAIVDDWLDGAPGAVRRSASRCAPRRPSTARRGPRAGLRADGPHRRPLAALSAVRHTSTKHAVGRG